MRKFLLLLPFLFSMIAVNAQYTLTDANDDPIVNGSTINIELPDADTNSDVHWHLHSSNSASIVFQVISTTQPGGAKNLACVGIHCYAPNDSNPHTEALDGNNEVEVILYYEPRGNSEEAILEYSITEDGNPNNSFTFSIHYTIATGIEDVNLENEFVAYPNPANQNVSISCNTTEASEIVLYNIVGKKVKKIQVNAGTSNVKIETSDLPAGTYFYSMTSDSKTTATKRLVIRH